MKFISRFLRNKNGGCSFVKIGIEAIPSDIFSIEWLPGIASYYQYYGTAVEESIAEASNIHLELGGLPHLFKITNFIESITDTNEGTVKCASLTACWMALGHNESDITYSLNKQWLAKIS